jgi:NAD(P)H-nitrite reductase large subunit
MKYLIIGNSAAAFGALEAIRKVDKDNPVTIVSAEQYPLYSRCLLPFFIADDIDEMGLLFRPRDYQYRLGVEILLGKKAEAVDTKNRCVICGDGDKLPYDILLLATGSSAKIPSNLPEICDGIFSLRTIFDALSIKKKLTAAAEIVVLGGGLIGLKTAFALNKTGKKVTVVISSRYPLSQMLDYDAGQIALRHAGNSGIKVLTLSDLTEIDSKEGKIIAVKIESRGEVKSEQWLPCNLLICAKGVNPNVGMLQGTEVKINQGIVTNPKMQTNIENIYAAGDVAETFDIATETNSINALWTCAVQQGKIAGYNMAGKEKNYDGSIGMNSINFPGLDIISFGVVKTKDEQGYETIVLNLPDSNIYKKIILKDNKIKGLI